MNVALIEMPAEVAREELKKYRTSLHRRADAEYEQIANGLQALSDGTPLLQLSKVFENVPLDAKGRPRLAIARADRTRVRLDTLDWRDRSSMKFDSSYDQQRGTRALNTEIFVRRGPHMGNDNILGYALVPIVPPDVRGTRALKNHFILWEVEEWADTSRRVGPDVDPYLLEHVGADLYAVVGEWDLTPIEQAILAGRRDR